MLENSSISIKFLALRSSFKWISTWISSPLFSAVWWCYSSWRSSSIKIDIEWAITIISMWCTFSSQLCGLSIQFFSIEWFLRIWSRNRNYGNRNSMDELFSHRKTCVCSSSFLNNIFERKGIALWRNGSKLVVIFHSYEYMAVCGIKFYLSVNFAISVLYMAIQ